MEKTKRITKYVGAATMAGIAGYKFFDLFSRIPEAAKLMAAQGNEGGAAGPLFMALAEQMDFAHDEMLRDRRLTNLCAHHVLDAFKAYAEAILPRERDNIVIFHKLAQVWVDKNLLV